MEMEKKKIKKLIKDVKENKNLALMLNRVLGVEEINWLYEHTKPKHQEWWVREEWKLVYYWPNGERY